MASSSTFSSEERRIVFVGRTGAGKSATANTLFGKAVFPESISGLSKSKISRVHKERVFSKEVLVVDTPGLFDSESDNKETLQEIVKCLLLSTPGPHVLALVTPVDRCTTEIQETFKLVLTTFGEKVQSHMLVIFTGKDDLDYGCTNIETFIETCPTFLKELLSKCGNRYVAVDNRAKGGNMITQQKEAMKAIESLIERNKGRYYSNSVYAALTEKLQDRVEEMRSSQDVRPKEVEGDGFIDYLRKIISENREEILEFTAQAAKIVLLLLANKLAKN